MPIHAKDPKVDYIDYILEVHNRWLHYSGLRTVAIPYEIPNDELEALLPMLNGAYLTGGSLDLINKTDNKHHEYYNKAKMMLDYSIKMKDEKGEEWQSKYCLFPRSR